MNFNKKAAPEHIGAAEKPGCGASFCYVFLKVKLLPVVVTYLPVSNMLILIAMLLLF